MIVVRNIFQLKFGKAKEVKKLIDENRKMMEKAGVPETRFLMDVTGPFYTLVMEFEAPSLAEYEKESGKAMGSSEFEAWYQKFIPLVESGTREIFSVVD